MMLVKMRITPHQKAVHIPRRGTIQSRGLNNTAAIVTVWFDWINWTYAATCNTPTTKKDVHVYEDDIILQKFLSELR